MTLEELKVHIKDNLAFYGDVANWDEDELVPLLLPAPKQYDGKETVTFPYLGTLTVKEKRGHRVLVEIHLATLMRLFKMEQ